MTNTRFLIRQSEGAAEMRTTWMVPFVSVFFACASTGGQYTVGYDSLSPEARAYFGSTHGLSSRLFILSRYGLPFLTGDRHRSWAVFDVEDLFIKDGYPPREEIWTWEDCTVTFCSLLDITYDYVLAESPPGDVRLELADTCTQERGDFVVEFQIDGLKQERQKTLYKVQILAKGRHRRKEWTYLYDTSPIVGRTGLRSVHLTAFVDHDLLSRMFSGKNKKQNQVVVLIVVWDFLSSVKREAVFALPLRGEGAS